MSLLRADRLQAWQNYEATLAALQADPEGRAEYEAARLSWDSARLNSSSRNGLSSQTSSIRPADPQSHQCN